MQRRNLNEIEKVIQFGTAIGWYTSLVPIHTTIQSQPRGFRSFDRDLQFKSNEIDAVVTVIERVRAMRNEGYLLYDSDQYLDDIINFVSGNPVTWRDRNNGHCDSPNLYFAVLPNGEVAPCCDHRMTSPLFAFSDDFVQKYRSNSWRNEVFKITGSCEGCMYGSYPEMTISMRFNSG